MPRNIESGPNPDETPESSDRMFVGEGKKRMALSEEDSRKLREAIKSGDEKRALEKQQAEEEKRKSLIDSLKPEKTEPGTAFSVHDALRRAMLMHEMRLEEKPEDELVKQKLEKLKKECDLLRRATGANLSDELPAIDAHDLVEKTTEYLIEETKKFPYYESEKDMQEEIKSISETAQRLQKRLIDEANRSPN